MALGVFERSSPLSRNLGLYQEDLFDVISIKMFIHYELCGCSFRFI